MRKRRRPRIDNKTAFTLNITSMCDMFTILLVFLLQTYSTSSVLIPPADNIKLPSSSSENNPTMALNLVVSEKEVLLEGESIAHIENRSIASQDLDQDDPSFIKPLFLVLEKRAKEAEESKKPYGQILMQADQSLPYETLRKVMYTASMAGYAQLKLATVVGE